MKDISVTQDLIEIKKLTAEVFGSEDKANQWLTSYNLSVGDTPLSLLNTENGANKIKKILNAIAYGGVV